MRSATLPISCTVSFASLKKVITASLCPRDARECSLEPSAFCRRLVAASSRLMSPSNDISHLIYKSEPEQLQRKNTSTIARCCKADTLQERNAQT